MLLATFLIRHECHEASLAAFRAASKQQGGWAAHSLAEVYSGLTRIPGPQRLSAEQALVCLEAVRSRLTTIALDAEEHYMAIVDGAKHGVVGGTIYDVLIAACALKANAEIIYTWNVEHFRRCGPEVARRVRTPLDRGIPTGT